MKFSSQLHEDYPSKEAIDKLSADEIKEIYLKAPFGYFRKTSSLVEYFSTKVDETFSNADFREFDKEYRKRVEEAIYLGLEAIKEKHFIE